MLKEEPQTIKWNPPKTYQVISSATGLLFISTIVATALHLLRDLIIYDETKTRIALTLLFIFSIFMMIITSKLLKCPKCKLASLKQEKKIRRQPICFTCDSCNIRFETNRIYTKTRQDHQ